MMRVMLTGIIGLLLAGPASAGDAALVKRVTELGGKIEREGNKPEGAIETIDLGGKPTTDADLKLIGGVATLNSLDLSKAKVTDDGLNQLMPLKKLRYLTLDGTAVTGKGLKHLAGLKLVSLSLSECPLDDAGLEPLAKIDTLERVYFWDQKKITDAGLTHLGGLENLSLLTLYGTGIDGSGLSHLTKCKYLADLDVQHTNFNDAGLKLLPKLEGLQRVHVKNTKVTKAEVEKVAKALPAVTINER